MKSLTSLDVAWAYTSAHIASFASRYPKTLTATVSLGLAGFAATAFGIAPQVPDAADLPRRTIVENVATVDLRRNLTLSPTSTSTSIAATSRERATPPTRCWSASTSPISRAAAFRSQTRWRESSSTRALNEEVHQPPRLGFLPEGTRRPEPDQLVVRLYPTTGIRLLVEAQRSDVEQPERASLDLEFAKQGGEGALPYEVLLHAAMIGDSRRFKHKDSIEETWRIMQPLLEAPPPVQPYEKGSWGPSAADGIVAGRGRWHEPWLSA